jgi:hypothetical protein
LNETRWQVSSADQCRKPPITRKGLCLSTPFCPAIAIGAAYPENHVRPDPILPQDTLVMTTGSPRLRRERGPNLFSNVMMKCDAAPDPQPATHKKTGGQIARPVLFAA